MKNDISILRGRENKNNLLNYFFVCQIIPKLGLQLRPDYDNTMPNFKYLSNGVFFEM